MPVGDDRRPARHRLDHHQPERLRPVDREEQRAGAAKEVGLLVGTDLADELHVHGAQQGLDLALVVLAIGVVHLGRDEQVEPGPARDLDGPVGALLRRDAPQEGEVLAGLEARLEHVGRQAVVDRRDPVGLRQRRSLVVRDRDDRHVAELGVDRLEVRDVEPAVERRGVWHAEPPRQREVEVVEVPVNHVEAVGLGRHRLQLDHLVRQRIDDAVIKPQGAGSARDQLRRGLRVTAGEQGDVVALANELLGQVGDDGLGASVSLWRHALDERRHLRDAHRTPRASFSVALRTSRATRSGAAPLQRLPQGDGRQHQDRRAQDPERERRRWRCCRHVGQLSRRGNGRWCWRRGGRRRRGRGATPSTLKPVVAVHWPLEESVASTVHRPSSPDCGVMVVVNAPVASAVTITDESGVASTEYSTRTSPGKKSNPSMRTSSPTVDHGRGSTDDRGLQRALDHPGRHRCGEQREQCARGDEGTDGSPVVMVNLPLPRRGDAAAPR